MNVYLETNFVLEVALLQEQHDSCDRVLELAESRALQLVVPAYSLVEPFETFTRRRKDRERLKMELDREFTQLARTATYADDLIGSEKVTALLIQSTDDEFKRFEAVRERLMNFAEVVPINNAILRAGAMHQRARGLSPQDAVVFAAVLSHLRDSGPAEARFLNRNSKDFDDPDIAIELQSLNCKLLNRFDDGLDYIRSKLRG